MNEKLVKLNNCNLVLYRDILDDEKHIVVIRGVYEIEKDNDFWFEETIVFENVSTAKFFIKFFDAKQGEVWFKEIYERENDCE